MTIIDPAHVAAAKILREQFQELRATPEPHQVQVRDRTRDLADYDRAFGLTDIPVAGPDNGEEVA